jgi:hypothetical protein
LDLLVVLRCAKRAIGPPIHPQPTRSVADLLASFVAEASTEDSTATLIAKSLPVIHELGGTCVCVSWQSPFSRETSVISSRRWLK